MPNLRTSAFFIFIAAAWLNPFAPGPSAAMVPWLVSLACVGAALWVKPLFVCIIDWPRTESLFLLTIALYFAGHQLWHGAQIESLATLLAWSCVLLMVDVGDALYQTHHLPTRNSPASSIFTTFYTTRSTRLLAKLWLVVALLSVLMALCQYLRVEHWFAPWISASADGTAYANLRQRNQFATFCGMGLLSVLFLLQTRVPSAGITRWQAAWPWLAATALAIGNGLSSSRTGGLQWLLIAALVWWWRGSLRPQVRVLAYGALGIYALVVLAMPWFAEVVGNASNGLWGRAQEGVTGNSRWWLYGNVLELIAQKPWTGWGWRELAFAHYSTHFDTRFTELLDNAHNLPLHLAVELGVPFALLFCGAVLWWIVRAAPWRERDATRQLAWGVLMLIGVHSMVEYPLWYGPFVMTLGLCIGLLQPAVFKPFKPVAQWNIAQAAPKYIAIALLALTGYAAFDYHRVSQIYLPVEQRSSWYSGDAMAAARSSVLFQRHARFAELVTTPVTKDSAPRVLELALDLIHFSPEVRVIEALIESATVLHRDELAMFHLARYKEVYPKDYAQWSATKPLPPVQ